MKPAAKLRQMIKERKTVWTAGAYDALSARFITEAGFDAILSTGYGISASHLGQPDAELYTMTENLQVVRQMVSVTETPIIADTDTGYGNAINVMRTVREFERAGVAGMIFEDQIAPKRCPACVETFNVITIEEAVGKIKAALDARQDPDVVIIARTDARPLEAAIERGQAYKEAGADVIQPISKGVTSLEEMRRFKAEVDAPLSLQILAWLEVQLGKEELEELAAVCTWPLVPLMTAAQALRDNLSQLIKDKSVKNMPLKQFAMADFNKFVGVPEIEELQMKYLPQTPVDQCSR
ncbi:MAG: isocitrate lyase/PEP mutase family protein [Deltaproteobacteria bacterium]|nr:isocitrate lyase/PEP mutase family protein [Deltaproteobacteria bacterium]